MRLVVHLQLALSLLALVFCPKLWAEPESLAHYQYATWSLEAGLPQVTVTSMVRDQEGWMWVGTQNGLARMDGQAVEVFRIDNAPALGSNWIKHLFASQDGSIWIVTIKQLLRWRAGTFEIIATTEQLGEVTALADANDGALWIAAGKLWRYDGELTVHESWSKPVRAMAVAGTAWLADEHNQVYELTAQGPRLIEWQGAPAVVRQMRVIKQRLWLATSQGLYRANGSALEQISSSPVSAMASHRDDLWVATEEGIYRLRGNRIEAQLLAASSKNLAPVTSLYVDEDQAFWLGSLAHGVRFYWRAPYVQLSAEDGFPSFSWSFWSSKSELLVGANEGLFQLGSQGFSRKAEATDIPGGVAYAVFRDSEERLWVGTREGLAYEQQGIWHAIQSFNGIQVSSVLETQQGDLLIASARGLYRWDGKQAKVLEGTEALQGQSIRVLLEDKQNNLWIGTEYGLLHWRGGQLTKDVVEPLDTAFVTALLQLSDGRLVVATYQSGVHLRLADASWQPLALQRGLPTQGAFGLFEYEGWLWLASGDGVQRLPINQLEHDQPNIQRVLIDEGEKPGRSRVRCCNGGGNGRALVHDHYAWFASLGGVVRIDLSLPETKVPVVKVRRVNTSDTETSAPLKDVEVHYGALDFRDGKDLRFRYRLIPYNENWQEADDRRVAYYTNLPAGSLRFEVQARRVFGQWGPTASTKIFVQPVYHETLWFRLLVGILIATAGYGIFRLRTYRLRIRGQQLALEVQSRTEQLEQANSELGRLNTELHQASITDPLTGLHNRRFMTEQITYQLAVLKRHRLAGDTSLVMGLFLVDLDWFKHINDRYGHGMGDALLAETAVQMKKVCRQSDMLFRWGGEEFLLLAPEIHQAEFSLIADRLRLAAQNAGRVLSLVEPVSASIGYAPHPLGQEGDLNNWALSLALADFCLYEAKAAGRNCSATAELDGELLAAYKEAKVTSTEFSQWRDEGRLKIKHQAIKA